MPVEVVVGGDGVECTALVEEGRDPGVLFLHGYSFRYAVWTETGAVEVPSSLGLSWAAPDMPYGKSTSCSSRTFSVDVNLAVAREAAKRAGMGRMVVVGASLGARYAVYMAHAANVRGLVLVGPALGRDEKAWDLARGVRVPVLIIWGDRDRVVGRKAVELLSRTFPRASLEVVEGAGHVVHRDSPDEFRVLLKRFLEGIEA